MNISRKRVITATLVTAIMGVNTLFAWSGSNLVKISAVTDSGIKTELNGKEKQLKNEDGSAISPIIFNNRTYLPLRSMANFLGMGVSWDESKRTVGISADVHDNTNLSGVKMPNVSSEMNSAGFWISKTADANRIVLDKKGIELYNKSITEIKESKVYDLKSYPESMDGNDLKKYINELPVPEEDRYNGDKKVEKSYYEPIIKNMNIDGIKEINNVSYGFTVKRTNLRTLPVKDPSYGDPNDFEFDYFQETALEAVEPVLILHKTLDKKWCFVQASNYRGWLNSSDIAISASKNEWAEYLNDENYVVVTANRLSLPNNPYTPELSGISLGMGCRVVIFPADKQPTIVDGMLTAGNIVVKMPTQNKDGILEFKNAMLPQRSDVSFGYLPYTKANVLTQAFKILGDRYGWGGLWESRDCSSLVCDIYKSFGIILPRNTSEQEIASGMTIKFTDESYQKRSEIITSSVKPCSGLYMENHAMLYLGEIEGKKYVIQSVYAYGDKNKPKEGGGYEKAIINSVVVSDLDICKRNNGKTFLENIRTVKTFE